VLRYFGISSSGYYSYLNRIISNQELRKEEVKQEIIKIYNESKQIYGAPKITKKLNNIDYIISEKAVGNYMRELEIKAIWVSLRAKTS